MAVYNYDSNTGNLTTLATSGQRIWVGSEAQCKAAQQAGTLPNNAIICITDDEVDTSHYSTDETFTGMYWIDGKKVYRKVVVYTETRASGDSIPIGTISNMDTVINCNIMFKASNGVTFWAERYSGSSDYVVMWIDTGGIITIRQTNGSSVYLSAPIYAIVEYTKTTDD